MYFLTVLAVILCLVVQCAGLKNVTGYYSWSEGNRTELYCPNICLSDDHPDRCCACDARRCWDVTPDECPTSSLQLEYIDIYGNGVIVGSSNTTYVRLEHTNGKLTKVPADICSFSDQLVILDLRHNHLTDVSSLQCLHKLDTLRLDNNLIANLDNSTFFKMKDLRVLTFKNNLLKNLSPNVINLENGNILSADFSDNTDIETVDVTNIVHAGPFCQVDFTNTSLEHVTNENEYTIINEIHGPGVTILEHTNLGSFLNFTSLGVSDFQDLGKYFSGRIEIDASSVNCDCSVYPILSSFPKEVGKYWPNIDNSNFTCQTPDYMKGMDLVKAYKDGNFDGLICDISENPDCPSYYCHCLEQPSLDKILVNCTNVGFTSMPPTMPVGTWGLNKIDLILAKNQIENLANRDYLERLVNLDLRENSINSFNKHAVEKISATINVEDQIMSTLPVTIKEKDPLLYTFGEHPITCDCSNLWIGDWIRFKHGHGRLNCLVSDNVIAAENVDASSLGCNSYQMWPKEAIITAVMILLTGLVMVIGLCYIFRYDIVLLRRRFRHKKHNTVGPSAGMYDVFISFYADNSEVFGKVDNYFRPELHKAGYSVFVPMFDIISGDVDHQTINAVDISQNFVIVLCNDYADNFETINEFNTIWSSFLNDKSKHIIVINFNNLDSGSVHDNRLKALRRTKYCLDFLDRNSKLMSRLFKIIGKPKEPTKTCASPVHLHIETDKDGSHTATSDSDAENEDIDKNDKTYKGKARSKNVFNRLARPKPSSCDCVHRVCYLHADAFDEKAINARRTNTPFPPSAR